MGDRPVIRLFRCCPIRAAFDGILRDVMIPDLQARPGLLDVRVGRTGSGELGERLVASVWRSEAAMFDTLGPDVEDSGFHPEFLTETTNRSIEILPLEIVFQASPDDMPALMRLARGTVRAGELEPYVEAARAGAAEDVARGTGPMAFYLAPRPPDAFTTLSVWPGWTAIEAATGADIRRPVATQHAQRLVTFEATHYEIVQGLVRP